MVGMVPNYAHKAWICLYNVNNHCLHRTTLPLHIHQCYHGTRVAERDVLVTQNG